MLPVNDHDDHDVNDHDVDHDDDHDDDTDDDHDDDDDYDNDHDNDHDHDHFPPWGHGEEHKLDTRTLYL